MAAGRDARFTGWNKRKMEGWRADLNRFLDGDKSIEGDLASFIATAWQLCGCGRPFQSGPKEYRRCYTCSNADYAEGSTACVICQRRHASKFPCCKFCTTAGHESVATLKRSLVMRRDGYNCGICGTDEGQMDIHHILPDGSAYDWNLEILCVADWVVLNASKAVGPLDELVWLERALAYDSYLSDYLDVTEKGILREQLRGMLGSDFRAAPPRRPYNTGECDPVVGMINVLDVFGREGIEVSHLV